MDPRIRIEHVEELRRSNALIVNIDYPLGLAAYHILKIVGRSIGELRGVYVMGKAATLNGKIGDVLIPNVVYDEHTDNTYSFAPAFSAADVEPYLAHGSVLDNQKAVTSRGTFLQNATFLDALYRDFFTDVEMEAGPYLNAIYEHTFAERHPTSTAVSFLRPPFDLGFLHYASDTPYSKGMNLGSRNLSYFGMDPDLRHIAGGRTADHAAGSRTTRLERGTARSPLQASVLSTFARRPFFVVYRWMGGIIRICVSKPRRNRIQWRSSSPPGAWPISAIPTHPPAMNVCYARLAARHQPPPIWCCIAARTATC